MKPEHTNLPASFDSAPQACRPGEILLADALDGLLRPGDEAAFTYHMAHCPACAALYEEARKGREWLEFLSPEPEAPAGLLSRILEHTGPGQTAVASPLGTGIPFPLKPVPVPVGQRLGLASILRRSFEPRLLMTAAMAFFSLALTLNLSGVQLRHLRVSSLRPAAVRSLVERRLTMASTPIIRYYDHLRLVNEVEARVRELRRNTQIEVEDEQLQRPKDFTPATPGQSEKLSPQKRGGDSGGELPQQGKAPARINSREFLEASLMDGDQPARSGGSAMAAGERSTVWTA